MPAIRKFLDLLPKERLIFAQAWWLFLLAELALRTIPFRHLIHFTQKTCVQGREKSIRELTPPVERLVWLVDRAGHYSLVNATCLKQALVLSWLLGRKGLITSLQIGVARHEDGMTAHAWLEREGQVICGHTGRHQYGPLIRT